MKNVMKRLAVCGLCVSMLAGCGKTTDTAKSTETKKNIEIGNQAAGTHTSEASDYDSVLELQLKYADQEPYEYTEPMYNLENNHTFTYEIGEKFYDVSEYDAFKVYSDSNLENSVDITIEEDYDTDTLTISPNLVFRYEKTEDIGSDGTWGSRSKFWLVQYLDTETGEELEKPLVTVFSIAQEMNTPTLKQSVGGDGYYKLSWSSVEGADYYEVYEYDPGLDYAELAVTTENLECSNADFSHVQDYTERFKEKYKDTEIDVDTQHSMNHFLDDGYTFFVVAKSNDGKHSGMSNECNPQDIMNQIPVSQNWDFQTEYTGSDILALPAYVDIDMMDGSVGKYLIEYHGATVNLLEDGTILVEASIKNLPIAMYSLKLTGVDYDTFMAQTDILTQRGDELEAKTGTASQDMDIPFVPDSQEPVVGIDDRTEDDEEDEEEGIEDEEDGMEDEIEDEEGIEDGMEDEEDGMDDEIEDEEGIEDGIEEDEEDGMDDEDEDMEEDDSDDERSDNETVTTAGIELPANVAETVYANSSLSEWIAWNLLAHNETISLEEFNEASDTEKLEDALLEAYKQNPLCGTLDAIAYDYESNSMIVTYVQSKEEQQTMQQDSLKKAAEIADTIIKEDMSDYEKEVAINQYLCDNAQYNQQIMDYINEDGTISQEAVKEFANSFTPYGVLVENLGVCESYAEAFQLVAREAGLESIIVTGTLDGVNHEWNRVQLDDKWYTLDVTNNDNEFVSNALCNLSDEVASEILKEDDVTLINDYIQRYTADDMKNEYYTVNGLYTEDAQKAAEMLAEGLKENGKAVIRMDSSFGNASVEEIVQAAVNDAQKSSVMYYSFANVLSVIEQ